MARTQSGIYHQVSAGDGPVVVFIHGVTLDLRMWAAQVAEFGDAWRCITIDLRGHGRSAALQAGHDHGADILDVLDECGVEQCVLVGLSLGGYMAVTLAGTHPERCRALMLVDAWMPGPEIGGWSAPFLVARKSGREVALKAWCADPLFDAARQQPETWAAVRAMVDENDFRVWTEAIPGRPGPDPRLLAGTITAPTQVVVGERDLPGFRAVAGWLAATIPGAGGRPVAVVPEAGHLPPMETAARFNRELAAFVEA